MSERLKLRSNLKEILQVKGMTIRELSYRTDYHFETVRKLYHGKAKRIPIELIERVCAELNCSVGELLTLERNDEESRKDKPI